MEIAIEYGKSGLVINVPEQNLYKILSMSDTFPVSDINIEIIKSLLRPIGMDHSLFDMAKKRHTACILVCDHSRPVPNQLILPPILKTLQAAGMTYDDILILIATGLNRPNTDDEIKELVGNDIAEKYNVENHFASDHDMHRNIGKTSRGTDVWLDKRFLDAEFKITTGFIEPHFIAGFSGGREQIAPGISGIDTIKTMLSPTSLSNPNTREGVVEENPFHQEALEISDMAGVDFILNVALDENKLISGIFAGDNKSAHFNGIEYVQAQVTNRTGGPADIVITTAAGYPQDATYFHTIKGITGAMPVVKDGGTIIIASECSEGIGSKEFVQLLKDNPDTDDFLKKIYTDGFFALDQWQLQKFAQIAQKANIILVADGLSDADRDSLHIQWKPSVEEALSSAFEKHGTNAKITVIPQGPRILARVE